MSDSDPHNLARFIAAQDSVYADALSELKTGRKRTHWMWFIFPQIEGLGHSGTAMRYAIKSAGEARGYLQHPVLGRRLLECAQAVQAIQNRSAADIFGYPDVLKFRSSLTLFASVSSDEPIFKNLIMKFFVGHPDDLTLEILGPQRPGGLAEKFPAVPAPRMNAGTERTVSIAPP